MKKEQEQIRNARVSINGLGSVNVHLEKMYDRGHMKRLLDYLGYALDQWQVSVIKLETLKQEQHEILHNQRADEINDSDKERN